MSGPDAPDWLPAARPAFVPRSGGFGARLLGLDPEAIARDAEGLIRCARQERDLLRPDLVLAGAAADDVVAAVGRPPREDWAMAELGDPSAVAALAAAVEAARALTREGPVGVLLPGPVALAAAVAGEEPPDTPDRDWEDLVDACGMVLCDAAGPVLDAGAHVVLEEPRAPGEALLELTAPLWNVLRHRRRPCLVVVLAGGPGALAGCDAVAAVAHGAGAATWDDATEAPNPLPQVLAPRLGPAVSPEHVQVLVRELRAPA